MPARRMPLLAEPIPESGGGLAEQRCFAGVFVPRFPSPAFGVGPSLLELLRTGVLPKRVESESAAQARKRCTQRVWQEIGRRQGWL